MDEMDKGDVEVIMVKIDIISGFLGAGKTTFIKKLLEEAIAGEKVVLTGTLSDYKREEAAEIIERMGGSVAGSVSKNTTMVLAGENAGGKLDKARALGIKIIDEETFKTLIKT